MGSRVISVRRPILARASARARRRGARALPLAICCAALAAIAAPCLAGANVGEIAETEEWAAIAELWHAMLDHSSDQLYDPERFRRLADDVERADDHLSTLVERGMLSEEVASELRRALHRRYEYLDSGHYTDRSRLSVSRAESASMTAQWIIEFQLALLRRAGPEGDRELVSAAQSNIGYQLTFLGHFEKFQRESLRRRKALQDRKDAGEEADLKAFEAEYHRRLKLLLDAYRDRRLPHIRPVDDALPYVFALTATRCEPRDSEPDLPRSGF